MIIEYLNCAIDWNKLTEQEQEQLRELLITALMEQEQEQ